MEKAKPVKASLGRVVLCQAAHTQIFSQNHRRSHIAPYTHFPVNTGVERTFFVKQGRTQDFLKGVPEAWTKKHLPSKRISPRI